MKIFYLCDRRACEHCSPECKHTTDVRHAANFEMNRRSIWEVESEQITRLSEINVDATINTENISALAAEIGRICADGVRCGSGI